MIITDSELNDVRVTTYIGFPKIEQYQLLMPAQDLSRNIHSSLRMLKRKVYGASQPRQACLTFLDALSC